MALSPTFQFHFKSNFVLILFIMFTIFSLTAPSYIACASDFSPENNSGTRSSRANLLPVPVLNVSSTELFTLENLVVDASSSFDSDGFIVGYFFQFEDGTESGWVTTPVIEHVYSKERYYTIRLKVMDNENEESSYWAKLTVNIKDRLPHIVLEEEIEVDPATEVVFEGYRCWDEDGYIINYTWEFEDNTTAYGPNVTHIFKEPGIYNIFLTILDDDRKTNKSSMRVIVREEGVASSRTKMGIFIVISAALLGVFGILAGKRIIPTFGKLRRKRALTLQQSIDTKEAEVIQNNISSWFEEHGDKLPEPDRLKLPEYAEPFIYQLALVELHPEKPERKVDLEKEIDKNTFEYVKTRIVKHEQLGAARYYVPRSAEQKVLAAFVARKARKYKNAGSDGGRGQFTEEDKHFTDEIIELLGKCWKATHSFKARALDEQTKLYLALMLCEKTGKRHFGSGKIEEYEDTQIDTELDLIDELLELFIAVWNILKFEEYKDRPAESKLICAIYTYEIIGAYRYLGKYN
jgi:hypothetical protein